MKVNLFLISLFITNQFLIAQERLGSFTNDLKTSSSTIKDVIPIVNDENNDVAVFVADAKNVYGYKLNDKFKVTAKITSEEKRRKYKTLLGYSIPNEDTYKIILTNVKKNKFLVVDFSFSENKSITKEITLANSAERIIQTLSVNNQFYLLTAIPFNDYDRLDGSEKTEDELSFSDDFINIYTLDENNDLQRNGVDISKLRFVDKNNKRIKTRTLLLPRFDGEIPKIDVRVSNPIDITARTSKMYGFKNKIVFTFDKNNDLTQILEISLDDYSLKKMTYEKHLPKAKRTNSFLLKDTIFMASANRKELLFEIVDAKSKNVLKELHIYEDQEIDFKNSPIVQRGGAYAGYRELKTAKQFLRKITADKFGISVLKTADKYEFSIGGYSPQASGGGMMMPGFGGIPMGTIGGATIFFNPAMFAYNSSSGTKSTQIDCLFDLNFENITGDIPMNAFDRIDEFLDNGNVNGINEVFNLNESLVLGIYHQSSKVYAFYKF